MYSGQIRRPQFTRLVELSHRRFSDGRHHRGNRHRHRGSHRRCCERYHLHQRGSCRRYKKALRGSRRLHRTTGSSDRWVRSGSPRSCGRTTYSGDMRCCRRWHRMTGRSDNPARRGFHYSCRRMRDSLVIRYLRAQPARRGSQPGRNDSNRRLARHWPEAPNCVAPHRTGRRFVRHWIGRPRLKGRHSGG